MADRTNSQSPGSAGSDHNIKEAEMDPPPDYAPKFHGSGRLEGKIVIISGGDSGIGRACSALFAREGAKLAIIYHSSEGDAEQTRSIVDQEGGEALLLAGDVGDKKFAEEGVKRTIDHYGRLDVLVNNAAEQHHETELTDIGEEQMTRTFRSNVFGYFFLTQAALPYLKRGASIVNTASITAYRGSPELMDYASTRGAIVAFTRSLSANLAEKGIRVNGVAPGPIWTPLIPSTFPADKIEHFGDGQPLGRKGQPNEVAPCQLFLACDDSSYMTGQFLHPNGGEIVGS